jgi:hypothetical protein
MRARTRTHARTRNTLTRSHLGPHRAQLKLSAIVATGDVTSTRRPARSARAAALQRPADGLSIFMGRTTGSIRDAAVTLGARGGTLYE